MLRTRFLGLFTIAVVAFAGCSSDGDESASESTTTVATEPTSTTTAGAPQRCTTDDLSFALDSEGVVAEAQNKVSLQFTNTSDRTCWMEGYPGIELRGPLSGAATTYVEEHRTGEPARVEVASGQVATSTLTYLSVASVDEAACNDGVIWTPTDISVIAPDETEAVTVPWTGGTFNNCQAAATRPGDYVSPITVG